MTLSKTITTSELMAIDYKYNFSEKELIEDWKKLINTKDYKTGSQFKPGMKICQHFFPNFWNIENDKGLSFAQAWKDPIIMDKVRQWGLQSMSQLWLSWIRRAVYMAAGLPNSSFYRPHFAKQICEMSNKKLGTLFDPCAGWAGRMLGTVSCGWNYISCDPNKETYDNIIRVVEFLEIQNNVNIKNIPVEDLDFSELNKVDIVLTSPPYFNLEIYNSEKNQSYNKYNSFDLWKDNWLIPLMSKCLDALNDDGISAWNVMNFSKNNLTDIVINFHESKGWRLKTTVGFQSPLANIRNIKNKDVTYIFQKA